MNAKSYAPRPAPAWFRALSRLASTSGRITPEPDSGRALRVIGGSVLGSSVFPAFAVLVFGLLVVGCGEDGGPNTTVPFRVVLIEPTPLSTNISCTDTIHVTFNVPIDTTAVFDDEHPGYFVAGINSGAVFDGPGTSVSNSGRTLNLPFTFVPSTNFTFNFLIAQGENGEQLETPAQTTFQTAPSGQQGCP
jgi:hypothetical protein